MLIRTLFRDPLTTSHASLQSDSHSSNFSIIILRMDKTKGNFIIIFMHAIESKKKKKKKRKKTTTTKKQKQKQKITRKNNYEKRVFYVSRTYPPNLQFIR